MVTTLLISYRLKNRDVKIIGEAYCCEIPKTFSGSRDWYRCGVGDFKTISAIISAFVEIAIQGDIEHVTKYGNQFNIQVIIPPNSCAVLPNNC